MEEFAPGSENVHQKWKNGSKYIKDTLSTLEVKYRLFVIPSRQVVGSTAWGGEVPQSDLDLVTWPSFHSDGFPLMAMNHEYKGKLKIPILLKWLASIELKSQFRQDSQCWTYSSYLAHMVHHLAWAGRSLWRPHRTLTHLRWLFWELVEIETVQDNRNATVQDRIHLIFGWFCLILFFNLIVASPPIASHQNGSRVLAPLWQNFNKILHSPSGAGTASIPGKEVGKSDRGATDSLFETQCLCGEALQLLLCRLQLSRE